MELRWNIVFSLILTKTAGEILSEWIPAWAILKSCNQNSWVVWFFLAGQSRTGPISFRCWTKRRGLQDEFPCDNRKLLLACRRSRRLARVKKSDWSFWKSSWLVFKGQPGVLANHLPVSFWPLLSESLGKAKTQIWVLWLRKSCQSKANFLSLVPQELQCVGVQLHCRSSRILCYSNAASSPIYRAF